MNLRILNDSLEQINNFDIGQIEYPYNQSNKIYLENKGNKDIYQVTVEVVSGLSIKNFSSPPMIEDAYIISHEIPLFNKYYEFIMIEPYKIIDIANFPTRTIDMVCDPDRYFRNIISNMAIKFYFPLQLGNSRIYVSEAKYLAGVAKDINGSSDNFTSRITIDRIKVNEQIPIWFKIFLRQDMTGEMNPRKLNLLIRGQEYA